MVEYHDGDGRYSPGCRIERQMILTSASGDIDVGSQPDFLAVHQMAQDGFLVSFRVLPR